MPNGEVDLYGGMPELNFDFDLSDIFNESGSLWGSPPAVSGDTYMEQLLNLIKSGMATPERVASILGLQSGEYDPKEFRMPTQQQTDALEYGAHTQDLFDVTKMYQPGMKEQASNIGSMVGGLRTSQDKVRSDLLASQQPYRGAMTGAQEGIQSSMHTAGGEMSTLIDEWIRKANIA